MTDTTPQERRVRELRERMRDADVALRQAQLDFTTLRDQAYAERGQHSDTDLWLRDRPEFQGAIADTQYALAQVTALAAELTAECTAYEFLRARALERSQARHPSVSRYPLPDES